MTIKKYNLANIPQMSGEDLKQWFLQTRRDLPWRYDPTPYAVWVSEVMLQQTQVSVVLPYFLRWMERYPTMKHLAESPLDEVIKLWEGLGYYSRARRLHEGAKYVLEKFQGELPSDPEELAKIKGLGPYTIGAICSFAFHQRTPAVDGNVIRVLARHELIEADISQSKTVKHIWNRARELLPEEDSWIFNEALIELGATICTRQPQCLKCPLKKSCQGFLSGKAQDLPYKSAKTKIEQLYRAVPVVQYEDRFLVKREKSGKIMGDLHEFPYFETDSKGMTCLSLEKKIQSEWCLAIQNSRELPLVTHSFTRYKVCLKPIHFIAKNRPDVDLLQWMTLEELAQLAFSSGHRRILNQFTKDHHANLTH